MRRRTLLTTLGLTLLAPAAWAHMMPAQYGTLNVMGNAVFAALSFPVSALSGVDDDGDGRLSQREIDAHAAQLIAEISRRFRVVDGDVAGRVDLVMPMAQHDERDSTSMAGSTQLMLLHKTTFTAAPRALRVEADLFGASQGEQQLTIKAMQDGHSEMAVLTRASQRHAFFRTPSPALPGASIGGRGAILLSCAALLAFVILSAAKDLHLSRHRSFATLRMTNCSATTSGTTSPDTSAAATGHQTP